MHAIILIFGFFIGIDGQRTPEEWKSRQIYHILTDRFSPAGETPTEPCTALRSWCGGNFTGIEQRLDYIKNLGADAVWISPIILNTEGGYHGYWAKNIYMIEPHWGTSEDLKSLIAAAHSKDMWIMVDVVPNHMGYPFNCGEFHCDPGAHLDFTAFTPFNEDHHYHEYCQIEDWNNQTQNELCRLANLPDLNQTVPFVRQTLLDWIRDLTHEYNIDGYRVDTVKHVAIDFWPEWQEAADTFCLGEVWTEDNISKVAIYQTEGKLDSVFNFPLVGVLKGVWHYNLPGGMLNFDPILTESRELYSDTHVLGNFVDNHDVERFLNLTTDRAQFRNALTLVMFWEGIPIIYYGSEQGFHGGRDPDSRESLWPHYDEEAELYQFIKEGLDFRKSQISHVVDSLQVNHFVDEDTLIFSRAEKRILVCITRVGSLETTHTRSFALDAHPEGTAYVNIREEDDVISVDGDQITVTFNNGEPKVYFLLTQTGSATNIGLNSFNIVVGLCMCLMTM